MAPPLFNPPATAADLAEVFEALAAVPAETDPSLVGLVQVYSTLATGDQLKHIERVLLDPPQRADWVSTVAAVVPALYFAGQTLIVTKCEPKALDLIAIVISVVAGTAALVEFFHRRRKPDKHYEDALATVRWLIQLQEDEMQQKKLKLVR